MLMTISICLFRRKIVSKARADKPTLAYTWLQARLHWLMRLELVVGALMVS